jgi:hypothetical protein
MTLCVICTVHVETRNMSFLVKPQNQGRWFISGLASKHSDGFLLFGLKTGGDGFLRFGVKTSGTGLPVWVPKLANAVL